MSIDDAKHLAESWWGTSWWGKALLGAALTGVLTISGATLHSVGEHTSGLAKLSQQVADLSSDIQSHNSATDRTLGDLLKDDQAHSVAIATASAQIVELERERAEPSRFERETALPLPRVFVPVQNPVQQLGSAIGHLFGIRARGHRGALHRTR